MSKLQLPKTLCQAVNGFNYSYNIIIYQLGLINNYILGKHSSSYFLRIEGLASQVYLEFIEERMLSLKDHHKFISLVILFEIN